MCLFIAVFSIVFGIKLFMDNLLLYALLSFVTGIFFIYLMINNIITTKKRKEKEKQNDN